MITDNNESALMIAGNNELTHSIQLHSIALYTTMNSFSLKSAFQQRCNRNIKVISVRVSVVELNSMFAGRHSC